MVAEDNFDRHDLVNITTVGGAEYGKLELFFYPY